MKGSVHAAAVLLWKPQSLKSGFLFGFTHWQPRNIEPCPLCRVKGRQPDAAPLSACEPDCNGLFSGTHPILPPSFKESCLVAFVWSSWQTNKHQPAKGQKTEQNLQCFLVWLNTIRLKMNYSFFGSGALEPPQRPLGCLILCSESKPETITSTQAEKHVFSR